MRRGAPGGLLGGVGDDVCLLSNITRKGRVRRAVAGVVAGAAAFGALLAFDASFDGRAWRLVLVPVIGFAALCLFQAQERT